MWQILIFQAIGYLLKAALYGVLLYVMLRYIAGHYKRGDKGDKVFYGCLAFWVVFIMCLSFFGVIEVQPRWKINSR